MTKVKKGVQEESPQHHAILFVLKATFSDMEKPGKPNQPRKEAGGYLFDEAFVERDVELQLELLRHLLEKVRAATVLATLPQVLVEGPNPFLDVLGYLKGFRTAQHER